MTQTKKAVPCIVYVHRGDMKKLDRLLGWWTKLSTSVPLCIRLDETDEELPRINDLGVKYGDTNAAWSYFIGPPPGDSSEVTLEFYDEWKGMGNRLVYVTDSPSSIATFIITYEHSTRKDA